MWLVKDSGEEAIFLVPVCYLLVNIDGWVTQGNDISESWRGFKQNLLGCILVFIVIGVIRRQVTLWISSIV
jgi:hypothetical protein